MSEKHDIVVRDVVWILLQTYYKARTLIYFEDDIITYNKIILVHRILILYKNENNCQVTNRNN